MQDLLDEDEPVEKDTDMTADEKEAIVYYEMMKKRRRAGEDADSDMGTSFYQL